MLQQDDGSGNYGLRAGEWKLVRLEKRGKSEARVSKTERAILGAKRSLYNLTSDPGETNDVSAAHPDIVQRMTAQLDKLISDKRSRPREQP